MSDHSHAPGSTTRRIAGTGVIHAGQAAPPAQGGVFGQMIKTIFFVALLAGIAYGALVVMEMQGGSSFAEVIFLRGQARIGARVLALHDKLPPGEQVELSPGARCVLQLPSGVVLKLASEARVTFGKSPDAPIKLERGDLGIEPAEGAEGLLGRGAPQTVQLPDGRTLRARSKRYEVKVDKQRSVLAVFEGAVEVDSGAAGKVTVGKDEGGVLERGKSLHKQALPVPPKILSPTGKLTSIASAAECTAVDGAVAYTWEARAALGMQTIWSHSARAPTTRLPGLPADGSYRLTVRAVIELDGGGRLEGVPSATVTISVDLYHKLDRIRALAHNFLLNGKAASAEARARDALEIYPGDPRMLRTLALALLALDRIDDAVAEAGKLKSSPEQGAADLLGEVLLELKKKHADHPGVRALGS